MGSGLATRCLLPCWLSLYFCSQLRDAAFHKARGNLLVKDAINLSNLWDAFGNGLNCHPNSKKNIQQNLKHRAKPYPTEERPYNAKHHKCSTTKLVWECQRQMKAGRFLAGPNSRPLPPGKRISWGSITEGAPWVILPGVGNTLLFFSFDMNLFTNHASRKLKTVYL